MSFLWLLGDLDVAFVVGSVSRRLHMVSCGHEANPGRKATEAADSMLALEGPISPFMGGDAKSSAVRVGVEDRPYVVARLSSYVVHVCVLLLTDIYIAFTGTVNLRAVRAIVP